MTKQEQLKFHELMAHWWMAYATTGVCKSRNISRMNGEQLSDEEKIEDAMETSKRHIELYMEVAENWND